MTTLREAAQQALEALEIGYDSAKAEADQFHAAMAGYKPQHHAQMDADVQSVAKAITALRAALAEPDCKPLTDEEILKISDLYGVEGFDPDLIEFTRAIERAHGIKGW